MLQWLQVHRFRNVRPGTVLTFNEHMNVLLGRNGTGKTTLLDLISIVLRSDFSRLRDKEFDLEYALRSGRGVVNVRVQNSPSPSVIPLEGRRPLHARLSMVATLTRVGPPRAFEFIAEPMASRWRLDGEAWREQPPIDLYVEGVMREVAMNLGPQEEAQEPFVFLQALFQEGQSAWRFDEALTAYTAIVGAEGTREGLALAPPIEAEVNYAPVGAPGSRSTSSRFMPYAHLITKPEHGQSTARVDLGSVPLYRFAEVAGLKDMSMFVAVRGSQREEGGEWWRFGQAAFQFTLPDGTTFSHEGLSYGQKRLLAFLYYLGANFTIWSKYAIADELVNGMHHDWIRFCLDEIRTRQCFLTSQNPLLLDYIALRSPEEARKTFIQCRAELGDGRTQFVWSNLAADDAEEIFKDYGAGVQQVGEILRVRGLW